MVNMTGSMLPRLCLESISLEISKTSYQDSMIIYYSFFLVQNRTSFETNLGRQKYLNSFRNIFSLVLRTDSAKNCSIWYRFQIGQFTQIIFGARYQMKNTKGKLSDENYKIGPNLQQSNILVNAK